MSRRSLLLALVVATLGCRASLRDVLSHLPDDAGAPPPPLFDMAGDLGPLPSLCSIADVRLCEGFDPQIDSPPWEPVTINAAVAADATRAYRGAQSLHVHTNAGAGGQVTQGEITETLVVPAPTMFLRLFLYVPSPAPATTARLAGYLQPAMPVLGPTLVLENGYLTTQTASNTSTPLASAPLPLDQWVCIEWQVTQATAGELRVFVGDQELPELHYVGDTTTSPPAGRVSIGAAFFGQPAQPAGDLWIDEVAIDGNRIGCAR